MAGYTPPKDPAQRARRNKAPAPSMSIVAEPFHPRELPDDLLADGDTWHPATRRWWQRWTDSPLAKNLPAVDWSELEATAVLHNEYMKKRTFTLASELRLRMQKFGATPEDRMRLRILVADAEVKDPQGATGSSGDAARRRYGNLAAVRDAG